MFTKISFFSIVVLAAFSMVAKADLPETQAAFEKSVIEPLKMELDTTVKTNAELTAWNEAHKETLTKLNGIVSVLNSKWDKTDGQKNQIRENSMRDAILGLWDLETKESIGSIAGLKKFIEKIRDQKVPGLDTAQFSGRTRQVYFDGIVRKIDALIEASKGKEDPMSELRREVAAMAPRVGPHGLPYPTITENEDGSLAATPLKSPNVERVESLVGIQEKANKLHSALKACPTPKFIGERIEAIGKLEVANANEFKRIEMEVAKINGQHFELISGEKGIEKTRLAGETSAQADREVEERKLVKDAILATMNIEIVPFEGTTVAIGTKEKEVAAVREEMIEAMVTDVMSEKFEKEGHAKWLSELRTFGTTELTENDPATVKKFEGMPSVAKISEEVYKNAQATILMTKLDRKKAQTLPGAILDKKAEAKASFDKKMLALKETFEKAKTGLEAARDQKLAVIAEQKKVATTQQMKLAEDRNSLTGCQTNLPKLEARIRAFDKNVEPAALDAATHEVQEITKKVK